MSDSFTGIEIGSRQVKMTQCEDNSVLRVALEPLPDNYVNRGTIVSMEAMSEFLKEMAKKHRFTDKKCALVLPNSVAFSKRLTMPAMTVEHLKINLPYEFHDFINESRKKYVFDYCLLEMHYNDGGKPFSMDLMAAAAPKEKLQEYSVDILHAKKWITALLHIETEASGHPAALQKELVPISVRQITEDHLKDYCRFTIFNSSAGMALIAVIDEDNSQTGLLDRLGDICKECRRVLDVTVTIAVGHSCQELSEISRIYQSSVDALGYKTIVGTGHTIYINDVEPVSRGKLKFDNTDENDFVTAVKFGPEEKIRETVKKLMLRMDDAKVHARQQQLYMLSLFNCVTRLMQQYDLTTKEIFDTEKQYMDVPAALGKPEKFEAWILGACLRIHESLNRERDNTTKKVILEARRYIESHYQDPSLSVEMICRELHMSPAYFSTMFRKVTGQTYIAYLTEVRLQKAVELLNETDDKTYVIAQKVGYQEQNYFSYVFKKRFGISPTKYRGSQSS